MGSGKSTVCKIFRILGVPIFEADIEAKNLLNINEKIRKKIIRLFGKGIYFNNQEIDRKKLAGIIFNNKLLLQKVNQIIHPEVQIKFDSWVKKQNSVYVLHEAAILFESGFYKQMDQNILIVADEKIRIKRIIERDGISKKQALDRISKQWDDKKKSKLSTKIIYNNGELLIPHVLEIDNNLKKYGKIW